VSGRPVPERVTSFGSASIRGPAMSRPGAGRPSCCHPRRTTGGPASRSAARSPAASRDTLRGRDSRRAADRSVVLADQVKCVDWRARRADAAAAAPPEVVAETLAKLSTLLT